MAVVYKTVDATSNKGDIKLKGRIVMPFEWIWFQWLLGNIYTYEKLKYFLDHKRKTVNIMGEFLANLNRDFSKTGFPTMGMYDIPTDTLYGLVTSDWAITFEKPAKEEGSKPNIISLTEPLYLVENGKIVRNSLASAMDERSQNIIMFNHFIRNRYPMKLDGYMPLGDDITTQMPYRPETAS